HPRPHLVFAILKARTPSTIATTMIDERVEPLRMVSTDLVAMTVETFTARRAYQIAALYRRAGVPVVMGGHHPSMLPDEALQHADAVVVGDAEGAWEDIPARPRSPPPPPPWATPGGRGRASSPTPPPADCSGSTDRRRGRAGGPSTIGASS